MKVVILGGGVTGLAAAEKLSKKFKDKLIVIEKNSFIGGLAATCTRDELKYDLGSHRLHKNIPLETLHYIENIIGEKLLKRPRRGKMYLRGRFIRYPINVLDFLKVFSPIEILQFVSSYLGSRLRPSPSTPNFENVMIKQVGKKLYETFIKDYAVKLWGVPPSILSAKGTEKRIIKPTSKLLKNVFFREKDYYFYPPNGIGEIAQKMEERLINNGSKMIKNAEVTEIRLNENRVESISLRNSDGNLENIPTEFLISTIPIDDLSAYVLKKNSSDTGLSWRGIRLIYILFDTTIEGESETFYFPHTNFMIGRVSIIEKYSPYLNIQTKGSLLTVEVPCQEGDPVWEMSEEDMLNICLKEMIKTEILKSSTGVIKHFSIKIKKVYPFYKIGWEKDFFKTTEGLSKIHNLFTIGRRGLFLHCNIDHCIRQGLDVADFILKDDKQKDFWNNKVSDYLEFFVRD